jgi:uncharacterized protein
VTTAVPIGTVKGPGERPQEYTFITSDYRHARLSEFVYYQAQIAEKRQQVVGNITAQRLVRNLPDGFLADPDVAPQGLAEMLGLDKDYELYEVTVATIGYYDPQLHDFINPRIPPQSGQPVYLTSKQQLAESLNPLPEKAAGAATIGTLLTRPDQGEDAVPIVLSIKDIVSTHLAILASTGAGKSYTASVLLEEMLRPHNRAAVLIIDPHGEYNTLQQVENLVEFKDVNYQAKVKIMLPEKVRVRFNTLKLADIRYLLPEITDKQHHYLNRAFKQVEDHGGKHRYYGFQDLYDAVLNMKYKDNDAGGATTADALAWKLDYRFGSGQSRNQVFSDAEHNNLQDLFQPGQCTVLQLNEIDQQEQQVIVGTLLRRINDARMAWVGKRTESIPAPDQLPFPVFVLVEEAHRFAPAGATVVSTNILKQVLAEGRKFGVGVGLITQRPGKLDQDVLSQCQTQFILRIVNPFDQQTIASSVESIGRKMLEELPALTKGQMIIAGVAINTPVMCRVRKRLTEHGGQTFDAPQEWHQWFQATAQQIRQQEQAGLLKSDGQKREKYGSFDI